MDFFPYTPRKNQDNIIRDVTNAINAHTHFVFESGTGTGKTICTLSAALPLSLEQEKKIIYTTRTNAQQRQVIMELRAIKEKTQNNQIHGVGMQGRANMCILARDDPDIANGSSEELSRFCANQKKQATNPQKRKGCPYYRAFLHNKDLVSETIQWAKQHVPTAEEMISYCKKHTICPYEVNKQLMAESLLVVVPYIYIFDKNIRNMLLDWLSIAEEDIILIIDEAHNLPDYLRDIHSAQLTYFMLKTCLIEADKFGDPSLADGRILVSEFCKMLIEIVNSLRDNYIYGLLENGLRRVSKYEKEDALIPSHELETEILSRLKITSQVLQDIIADLVAYGEKIQEYRQKEGKLPRSFLHKLGVFLQFWTAIEMDQYIKLVVDTTRAKNPRIEAYCLDPSVGAGIFSEVHSTIHMSGTLKPLEEYRDSLDLPTDTGLVFYPSPFPKENRKILYTRDVTTRYEDIMRNEENLTKMWTYIQEICNTFPQNTIVFFPSFNILSSFKQQQQYNDIQRLLYIEEQSMSQMDLMDLVTDFKTCGESQGKGAALLSVMGGRISEGMDFPAKQLEIAVIVGIPYPKPTARQRGLKKYYDLKFGKGWEYTVEAPTARKLQQSIGRLIRTETDRGLALILDKRAVRFKKYLNDLSQSSDVLSDIHSFLKKI